MNNKGFYMSSTLITTLIVCMLLISTFYIPIIHSSVSIKNSNEHIVPYIEEKTALERLHGIFNNNISYNPSNSKITFNDIGKVYTLVDKDIQYEDIEIESLKTIQGLVKKKFEVWNKTDIVIDLKYKQNENHTNNYYNVSLELDGKDILPQDAGQALNQDIQITIPANFLYDEDRDEVNYGAYTLIVNSVNCEVEANIYYQKLLYREISITDNDNNEKVLVLKNSSNGVKVYLKDK